MWFRLGLGLWLGFGNLIGGAASGVRLANRPGMAGIVLELTHGVPCPGRGSFCPGNVEIDHRAWMDIWLFTNEYRIRNDLYCVEWDVKL